MLGSPPPMSDPEVIEALAKEIGLRLRRHGITGEERLVLYDRGDGVGAMPSAQLAELAGHPQVSVLLGGLAAWPGELEAGQVELEPVKVQLQPRLDALPTRAEVERRLGEEGLALLDIRTEEEFQGQGGYPCDPAPGAHPRRPADRRGRRSSTARACPRMRQKSAPPSARPKALR